MPPFSAQENTQPETEDVVLQRPYLLFLGDAKDQPAVTTAQAVAHWRPDWCIGQLRLPGCAVDTGLPNLSLSDAQTQGARTLVLGAMDRTGLLPERWLDTLIEAAGLGYDIASGLRDRLGDHPRLWEAALNGGGKLIDLRHSDQVFAPGTGIKRSGRRLLTVGTDGSVGKLYTAIALEREMRAHGVKTTFRATGQGGILIAGNGIAIDAVAADCIAGAVEDLCPAGEADHWDVIEGQGSLYHAGTAAVSLGLLHGAQPDALVLCHEPRRQHMHGLQHYSLPPLESCIATTLAMARLTNPAVRCVGVSFNTQNLPTIEAQRLIAETEERLGLPVVDPLVAGVGAIVDRMMVAA